MTNTAAETLPQAVARRLRGQLAERRITQRRLSKLTGWSPMYVNRRWRGEIALDLNDLATIESLTGISSTVLLIGTEAEQQTSLLPRQDSNLESSDLRLIRLAPRLSCDDEGRFSDEPLTLQTVNG